MPADDHVIGEVYYQLMLATAVKGGEPVPVVSAWRYDGTEKRACNSKSCDVPYWFLCFTLFTGEATPSGDRVPERLYIPSKAGARLSMLTWRAFYERVLELGEDATGWDNVGPEPDEDE